MTITELELTIASLEAEQAKVNAGYNTQIAQLHAQRRLLVGAARDTAMRERLADMKTIATLPTLQPGEVWFYDPYWRDWSPIGEDELSEWNRERTARQQPSVQSGTPPAGSKVWNHTAYALYQPETT